MADWLDAAAADSVPESASLSVEVGGVALVIARCGNEYYAIEDQCTHDGESLA